MIDIILDDEKFIWSFSKINSFVSCPLSFELKYIKHKKKTTCAFTQFGKFVHEIVEKYLKEGVEPFELVEQYKKDYKTKMTAAFPSNKYVDMNEKYFNQGLDYFKKFNGVPDKKKIKSETKHKFKIGKYKFVGISDFESDDEILDYKTKEVKELTRLNKNHAKNDYIITKSGTKIHYEWFIQLYLYCVPFFEEKGHYPKTLTLESVRENKKVSIDFDINFLIRIKDEVLKIIDKIYNTTKFEKGEKTSAYFCDYVCDQRYNCKHSSRYFDDFERGGKMWIKN